MTREPRDRSWRRALELLPNPAHEHDPSRSRPAALRLPAGTRVTGFGLALALACSLLAALPQPAAADPDPSDSPVSAANPALSAGLRGNQNFGGACNVPTDGAHSPLFGATPFSQQLMRLEEFGTSPLPQPTDHDPLAGSCCPSRSSVHGESNAEPCEACPLKLPDPHDADGNDCASCSVNGAALDDLLTQRIHPYPAEESESEGIFQSRTNDWEECIENTHTGKLFPMEPGGISSYCDGRPEGPQYGHQRWDEFFPPVYAETVVSGARTNSGLRDSSQSHRYNKGEFAPGGLYHNPVHGVAAKVCSSLSEQAACEARANPLTNPADRICKWDAATSRCSGRFDGTTAGIEVRFHPNIPVQDHQALWTFDGTFPPKLLKARYSEGVLFRNHNALPIRFDANRGFGNHFITTHEHNGHNPAESDGYTQAFFLPGQHYDYHWPMILAAHDPLDGNQVDNTDASDPRASTPCQPGESLVISHPSPLSDGNGKACTRQQKLSENATRAFGVSAYDDPAACGWKRIEKRCEDGRINVFGDWREIMSSHWFHDHMLDYTAQNVYKGNAAMFNMYSAIDRGNECVDDGVNLRLPSGCALGESSWGNRDYDINLELAGKAWGQDTQRYEGTEVDDTSGQLWFATFNTDGFLGDRMTINWLHDPYFDVRARRYRFRMLNAHVSRFLRIALVVKRNHAGGEFSGENPGTSYDRVPFHLIANDGNILEHAVPFDGSMDLDADGDTQDHNGILPTQSIAERYDIIVDFSEHNPAKLEPDDRLYMVNLLEHHNGKRPHRAVPLADVLSGEYERDGNCDTIVGKFLELRVHAYADSDPSLDPADYVPGKKKMIPLPALPATQLARAHHRTFKFGRGAATDKQPVTITNAVFTDTQGSPAPNRMGSFEFEQGGVSVNNVEEGQLAMRGENPWGIKTDDGSGGMLGMDPHRVSAAPGLGDLEIWHLEGNGGWSHNVHIHFEEGRILTRDGKPPPEWEKWARKDIYRVGRMDDSGSEVTVAIRFREFAGTYMEHCHNTSHEDHAMLMRWDIENPGQLKPFLTPQPQWNGCSYTESYELATASGNRSRVVGDPKAKEEFLQSSAAAGLLDSVPPFSPVASIPEPADENEIENDDADSDLDSDANAVRPEPVASTPIPDPPSVGPDSRTNPAEIASAPDLVSPPSTRTTLRAQRNAMRKAVRDARTARRNAKAEALRTAARSRRLAQEDTSGTHRQPSQSPAREEAERIRAAEQSQLAMTLAASQAERTRARAEQRTEQVRRLEERRAQRKAERDRRRARRR